MEPGESPPQPASVQTAPASGEGARGLRVMVVFNTVFLYGMERYVLELFDLLRPEVSAHFLLSYTTKRLGLPLLAEVQRRGLQHSFFSDYQGWPRIGYPHSLRELWGQVVAMTRGNLDVLRRARGCDAMYLPGANYLSLALLAALYFRLRGKRIVFGFHELARTRSWRLRFAALFVTDFVHHTRFGYEFVTRTNPFVARARTFICPGKTESAPRPAADPEVRRRLDGRRIILFAGQVALHKGIDILLQAFQDVSRQYPDLALHVVGDCPDEDWLRRRIAELGVADRTCYWGYREDIPNFLQMTYLYVHPSPPSLVQESFGRGVVEAMSQAVPAVCFRSGALQEIVLHEKTGWMCDQENAASLALGMRRFLDDPGFRDACGHAARERFEQCYSDGQIRGRWLDFLLRPA